MSNLEIEPINLDFDEALRRVVCAPVKPAKAKKERQTLGVIYTGDCLEIMKTLKSESIRVVVTSPPYNIKNSTGNGLKDGRGGKWANAALQNGYENHEDSMPHNDYVKWQRACLSEMMRLLRPDGAFSIITNGVFKGDCSKIEGILLTGFLFVR